MMLFPISDKPFCKPDQIEIYGVAKRERTRVTCDVIANPSGDLKFSWVFNSSSERVDLQENLIEVRGTTSLAHHTPQVSSSVNISSTCSKLNKFRICHVTDDFMTSTSLIRSSG